MTGDLGQLRKSAAIVIAADWFKYLFVGGTTLVIDFGILVILKQLFGVSTLAAATAGYWAGVLYNFTLNRQWTFSARETSRLYHHIWRYGVLLVVNYIVAIGFIYILGKLGINYAVAKILAVIVSMTWTYLAYKKLIFT